MERVTQLLPSKKFKNTLVFNEKMDELLQICYSQHYNSNNELLYVSGSRKEVKVRFSDLNIHVQIPETIVNLYKLNDVKHKTNLKVVNTLFEYKNNMVYLYPLDRDAFPDTELGMEQKAAFFLTVYKVAWAYLKSINY